MSSNISKQHLTIKPITQTQISLWWEEKDIVL